MKRTLLLSLAALSMAACATTTSPPPGPPGPIAPVSDRPVLTADQCAAVRAEPLPPTGVSSTVVVRALAAALGEDLALDFWEWLSVSYPGWARENAGRLDRLREACPSG